MSAFDLPSIAFVKLLDYQYKYGVLLGNTLHFTMKQARSYIIDTEPLSHLSLSYLKLHLYFMMFSSLLDRKFVPDLYTEKKRALVYFIYICSRY